jgi:hypothetical protein
MSVIIHLMEVAMLKPETVQILKRDGYTDKQIVALEYLVRCAEMSAAHDERMVAYSCRPFPSLGWICCRPTGLKFNHDAPFPSMRSFSGIMSGIRKKAFKEACPYIRYTETERGEYFDSKTIRFKEYGAHDNKERYLDREMFTDGTW